ncbi:MAG: SusC/RagA family TonB-linked outer membrane protein [Agriterribacter sp.]
MKNNLPGLIILPLKKSYTRKTTVQKNILSISMIACFVLFFSIQSSAQTKTVTGKVINAQDSSPLSGSTITVKSTNIRTQSAANGTFTISNVPASATLLSVTHVGYFPAEVSITAEALVIAMEPTAISGDSIIVVGYGTQKKATLTGSVATVKGSDITVAPVSNTSNTLAGRLPGINAVQSSGMPGSDASALNIRGFGGPLVIVDGVQMDLNTIDANQIESISVLKDGAASIYGARAGNGVILVTTKRGVGKKPVITVNSSYTLQGVTKMLTPPSSGQLATLQREAHIQSGKTPDTAPWTEEQIAKYFAGNDPAYPNTDWRAYTFRKYAPQTNQNISVRGGSDKIKYYSFLGYTKQGTMIRRNGGDFQRLNAQSNVDAAITDRLKFSMDISLISEKRSFPNRGIGNGGSAWADYYGTLPWYPAELPDPTKLAYGGTTIGSVAAVTNMEIFGYSRTSSQITRASGTLAYDFKFIKGLTAKAFVNYNGSTTYSKSLSKPNNFYTYDPNTDKYTLAVNFPQNRISESMFRGYELTQQYSLNFNRTFKGGHSVRMLGLLEMIDGKGNSFSASRERLFTLLVEQLSIGDSETQANDGSGSEYGRASYVGRFNYSYQDKYLLEAVIRADATSKYAPDQRWGYFPGVSAGWIITNERFAASIKKLDYLKLRLSYGRSGNDNVANFQYLANYALSSNALLNGTLQQTLYAINEANPFITWEKMAISNAGIDFELMNRSVYGSFDVFNRMRTGIPASRLTSLPSTTGINVGQENLNSLRDRGFELMIGTSKKFGQLNMDISANISWSRAKWTGYEEPDYVDQDQKRLEQKTSQWTDRQTGYVSDGLFTSQDQIERLPYTYSMLSGNNVLRPGDIIYKDTNGDGVLDWKDQVEIGKGSTPHWTYGITPKLQYKSFDLNMLFQGAFGYTTNAALGQFYNSKMYNERWTEENNNPNALVPRNGGASSNGLISDYRFKNTSYLRLKAIALGYSLPEGLLNKIGFKSTRLYIAGTNVLTFSSLNEYGIDPEAPSGSIQYYPQQRTFSAGLTVSF